MGNGVVVINPSDYGLKEGDSEKQADLIADLTSLKSKYAFESRTLKKKYLDVGVLLDKVIEHINV